MRSIPFLDRSDITPWHLGELRTNLMWLLDTGMKSIGGGGLFCPVEFPCGYVVRADPLRSRAKLEGKFCQGIF